MQRFSTHTCGRATADLLEQIADHTPIAGSIKWSGGRTPPMRSSRVPVQLAGHEAGPGLWTWFELSKTLEPSGCPRSKSSKLKVGQVRNRAMAKILEYDGVVIGAGHNGMICAGYLAKCGQKSWSWRRTWKSVAGSIRTRTATIPGFWHNIHSLPLRLMTRPMKVQGFGAGKVWYYHRAAPRRGASLSR